MLYFYVHSILHVHCISLLTSSMTYCPSLPAQPQSVSTLFSCTFYFTCTLYISPYISHDTLSITTCTTTAGKYSIFYFHVHSILHVHCISLLTFPITPCPSLPAQPQEVSTLFSCTFYILHVHCISLLTFPMTPCPSLPAQPQAVSTLFSCTFYFTCILYISPHILHDTLSITTCTTTGGKYSIFMYNSTVHVHRISLLTFPMTPCPSLPAQPQSVSTLFSCTFYFTCTLYISPYISHDTLSITTCTTTAGKYSIFYFHVHSILHVHCISLLTFPITPCPSLPAQPQEVSTLFSCTFYILHVHCISLLTFPMTPCPSLPAQPQAVSTLFSCTFYFTCILYISPHILHDTLSITTCTTTGGKYSIFMYNSTVHVHRISLLTFPMTPCPSLPAQPQRVSTLFSCTFYFTCTVYIYVYCLLLGGCYVYNSTINLLQPAQGDKVTISPVVRVCICVVLSVIQNFKAPCYF